MCYNVTMRKGSVISDNESFIYSALIATYAVSSKNGFKPSQFKFFIGLLSNWMSSFFSEGGIFLQNTQVIRQLDHFVSIGILNKGSGDKKGLYFLSKGGLIDALDEVVTPASVDKLDVFFFKYHFITFYKNIVLDLIKSDRKSFPKTYEIELRHLFDERNLIEGQKEIIQNEIIKLQNRINESQKQSELTKRLHKEGRSITDIINEIEKKYPYELNGQKNMNELFSQLGETIRYQEIMKAPVSRINTLWNPSLKYLHAFNDQLIELESSLNETI